MLKTQKTISHLEFKNSLYPCAIHLQSTPASPQTSKTSSRSASACCVAVVLAWLLGWFWSLLWVASFTWEEHWKTSAKLPTDASVQRQLFWGSKRTGGVWQDALRIRCPASPSCVLQAGMLGLWILFGKDPEDVRGKDELSWFSASILTLWVLCGQSSSVHGPRRRNRWCLFQSGS